MKVGIVGLPNVGKSTLFNALTKSYAAEAANFPFCTIEPNSGIVSVNDDRLSALQAAVNGQKIVPATVEFVDIAGIVKGASQGEGLGNKFLANIREASAILQVVRAFGDDDVHHVSGSVDARRDIEIINAELIIADLETLEKRLGDSAKKVRSGDKKAEELVGLLTSLKSHLEGGNLGITLQITDEEKELLKDSHFLTMKPFVYAVNVSESDIATITETKLREITGVTDLSIPVLPVCAKLEMDMLGFSVEERAEFVAELGLKHNPLDSVISQCYDVLGLQYYFTAGEVEVRAWTIRK